MAQQSWVSQFLQGPIFGVIVGFILSMLGTMFFQWNKGRSQRKILAASLYSELKSRYEEYFEKDGGYFYQDKDDFLIPPAFSGEREYFPIFIASANSLGLLGKEDARKIINFYVEMKGHHDTWSVYNNKLDDNDTAIGYLYLEKQLKPKFNELKGYYIDLISFLEKYL